MNAMNSVWLIAAAGLVLTIVNWAFLPDRRLPRHRVRHMRIRLRLRLHPGKGHATIAELWWRWGRLSAFRNSRRTRPSFTLADRVLAPASEQSAPIAAASCTRPGLTIPPPTPPRSGSGEGPSSVPSSTNTSGPRRSPGQDQRPSSGTRRTRWPSRATSAGPSPRRCVIWVLHAAARLVRAGGAADRDDCQISEQTRRAGWVLMPDRGSITANHYDHVHISVLQASVLAR